MVYMWSTIIGNKRQIEHIRKALRGNRLPNAYLFCGLKGIGKRRVADALAQALACTAVPSSGDDSCGGCAGCRKAQGFSHPDIFLIQPEQSAQAAFQSIKIESMRRLQAGLQFHPLEAPSKLVIIDDADRMTEEAANSLLKILEEPMASTHFVLITSSPHLILPTIRSRCQHLSFQPLAESEITQALIARGGLAEAQALRIARLSGGSLGTALSLEADFVDAVLGRFFTLVGAASSADILHTAEEWKAEDPSRLPLIFDILASLYRDLLRFNTTGDDSALIHREAAELAADFSPSRAERCLAEIARARQLSDTTANKQLMFEQLLFSLTS